MLGLAGVAVDVEAAAVAEDVAAEAAILGRRRRCPGRRHPGRPRRLGQPRRLGPLHRRGRRPAAEASQIADLR